MKKFLTFRFTISVSLFIHTKNNIVVIPADDMVFSDLGYYMSEISTSNLDTLAAHGLQFSQFYNAEYCCPTKASLLTGLQIHQASVGHMAVGTHCIDENDVYQGFLSDNADVHKINIDGVANDLRNPDNGKDWYTSHKWTEWGSKYINNAIEHKTPFNEKIGLVQKGRKKSINELQKLFINEFERVNNSNVFTTIQ